MVFGVQNPMFENSDETPIVFSSFLRLQWQTELKLSVAGLKLIHDNHSNCYSALCKVLKRIDIFLIEVALNRELLCSFKKEVQGLQLFLFFVNLCFNEMISANLSLESFQTEKCAELILSYFVFLFFEEPISCVILQKRSPPVPDLKKYLVVIFFKYILNFTWSVYSVKSAVSIWDGEIHNDQNLNFKS